MFGRLGFVAISVMLVACSRPVVPSPEKSSPSSGVSIRVVDDSGEPVAGIKAGVLLTLGGDEPSFRFSATAPTDAAGQATIDVEAKQLKTKAIVAVDSAGERIGVRTLNAGEIAALGAAPVDVALRRATIIRLEVACFQLAERGRPPRTTFATLNRNEYAVVESAVAGARHEFLAPRGKYEIEVRAEETHWRTVGATVDDEPIDDEPIDLGEVDLPATRFALLTGEPAPAIEHDGAWLGESTRLAELRGRVVLLEFWGVWCSDCIAAMPTLLDFYDAHKEQGLAIVGVHVDGGDGFDSPATIAEPLRRLETGPWGGRKMSFPSALAVAEETSYGEEIERAARCRLAAEFGVAFYPTTILIDRSGEIVRAVDLANEADAALVKELLAAR